MPDITQQLVSYSGSLARSSPGSQEERNRQASIVPSAPGPNVASPVKSTSISAGPDRRRRRSFRGAGKLTRKKEAPTVTVSSIPEDPSSSTSSLNMKASPSDVNLTPRNYQYSAFHQVFDAGGGVPAGGEYTSGVAPPPLPVPSEPSNSSSTEASQSSVPTRRSRALNVLGSLGKKAVREVLGGQGNNPVQTDLKVTVRTSSISILINLTEIDGLFQYYGRGGAGNKHSGQLPTIRTDSFGTRKNPPHGLHTPISSDQSSLAHTRSLAGSSYAPSVNSAPYTSSRSYGRASPIPSHRSLSPNAFGRSRYSASSYSGTMSQVSYEDEGSENWGPQPWGYSDDVAPQAISDGSRYYTHQEVDEEKNYDLRPSSSAGPPPSVNYTESSPYQADDLPPKPEEQAFGVSTQAVPQLQYQISPQTSPYPEYRSPSTTSISTTSTGLPPPYSHQLQVPTGMHGLSQSNESINNATLDVRTMQAQAQAQAQAAVASYFAALSQSSGGVVDGMGYQGEITPNPTLQLQALYAALTSTGVNTGMSPLQQQQHLLQNAGLDARALEPLATALAQMSLAQSRSPSTVPMPQVTSSSNNNIHSPEPYRPVAPNPHHHHHYSSVPPHSHLPVMYSGIPQTELAPQSMYHHSPHGSGVLSPHMTTGDVQVDLARALSEKKELERRLMELEHQRLARTGGMVEPSSMFPTMPGGGVHPRFHSE